MSPKCKACGSDLSQEVRFCTECGAQVAPIHVPITNVYPNPVNMPEATQPLNPSSYDTVTGPVPSDEKTELLKPVEGAGSPPLADLRVPVANPLPDSSPAMGKIKQSKTAGSKPGKEKAVVVPVGANAGAGSRKGLVIAALLCLMAVAGFGAYFLMGEAAEEPAASTASQPDAVAEAAASNPVPATETAPAANPTPSINPTPANKSLPATSTAPAANLESSKTTPASPAPEIPAKNTETPAANPKPEAADDGVKAAPVAAEKIAEPPKSGPTAAELIAQGNAHAGARRYQQAIAEYQKARQLNPGNRDIYYLLGMAYHQSGQLEQALVAYRQCTSGSYASVAANHVKTLERKLGKKK